MMALVDDFRMQLTPAGDARLDVILDDVSDHGRDDFLEVRGARREDRIEVEGAVPDVGRIKPSREITGAHEPPYIVGKAKRAADRVAVRFIRDYAQVPTEFRWRYPDPAVDKPQRLGKTA